MAKVTVTGLTLDDLLKIKSENPRELAKVLKKLKAKVNVEQEKDDDAS